MEEGKVEDDVSIFAALAEDVKTVFSSVAIPTIPLNKRDPISVKSETASAAPAVVPPSRDDAPVQPVLYGTVLYDFEGVRSDSELSFVVGDVVTITNKASMKENEIISLSFIFLSLYALFSIALLLTNVLRVQRVLFFPVGPVS